MVLVSDLREADLFFIDIENISNVCHIGIAFLEVLGCFSCHMCFETFLIRFFRSSSWGFFCWGNIPGAMIPRRTLQTLLLVEKPMSCWEAWILKKQAVGWHFTLTIALVGWDISMPSSEILSNSKSFIGLYISALWKQQVWLFPKKCFQEMFQEEVSNPSVIKNGWHSILVGRDFDWHLKAKNCSGREHEAASPVVVGESFLIRIKHPAILSCFYPNL